MKMEQRRNRLIAGICFLLCITAVPVFAQNTALQLTEMNLLYKGLNNPFKVAVDGLDSKDIVLKTSTGLDVKYAGEKSFIKVRKKSKRVEYITIGKLAKSDTQWLDTYEFRIRSLPQPTAQLGDLVNDGLPKTAKSIVEQARVVATMGR